MLTNPTLDKLQRLRLTRIYDAYREQLESNRYDRGSTLIAAQIPVEHWHETIGDPTLADAILDRLIHNVHTITLKGESMRKRKTT